MTRPLRIEFPGALYHVTARGDRRQTIFADESDRDCWLEVLCLVRKRLNFVIHASCQMGNHYHVMLETVEGNLSQGMRHLNSLYSQEFNRRHNLVGHVFQGRYKAILVQRESYLLELARYIVLNPVRARIVTTPGDWPWSNLEWPVLLEKMDRIRDGTLMLMELEPVYGASVIMLAASFQLESIGVS